MNYEETRKILTVLKTNYPQSFKNWTREQSEMFLDLWCEAFSDEPVQIVVAAVKSIIYGDTREFAPNIGQVKDKIYTLTHEADLTEQDAWNLVKKALRNSGYHAREEFDKLPPIVQNLVGDPRQLYEWSMTNSDQVNTVIASNFMRSYKARAKHEKEMMAIPGEIKKALGITTLADQMKIETSPASQLATAKNEMVDYMVLKDKFQKFGRFTDEEMADICDFVQEYATHNAFKEYDVLNSLYDEIKSGTPKNEVFAAVRIQRKRMREV